MKKAKMYSEYSVATMGNNAKVYGAKVLTMVNNNKPVEMTDSYNWGDYLEDVYRQYIGRVSKDTNGNTDTANGIEIKVLHRYTDSKGKQQKPGCNGYQWNGNTDIATDFVDTVFGSHGAKTLVVFELFTDGYNGNALSIVRYRFSKAEKQQAIEFASMCAFYDGHKNQVRLQCPVQSAKTHTNKMLNNYTMVTTL